MTTLSEKMESTLKKAGIGFREVRVRGSHIMVKTISRDTADKWALLLNKMGCSRVNIVPFTEDAAKNKGSVLLPTQVKIFLIGGVV